MSRDFAAEGIRLEKDNFRAAGAKQAPRDSKGVSEAPPYWAAVSSSDR